MADMTSLEPDLGLAHTLADIARAVSMRHFRKDPQQWRKPDGSLVTEADHAVEDAVRAHIAGERPADAMLGEERGQTGVGARRWIVDAIDGTHSFAAGRVEWGTLIALEEHGRIVVGVCDEPARERRYWAVRGHGAWFRDDAGSAQRLRVTDAHQLSEARSFVPPPEWVPDEAAQAVVDRLMSNTRPVTATAHPALQVASGESELAMFFVAGPWDLAAPSLIVEEAGGRFTDMRGELSIASGTAVFSNGRVHEAALRLTR